MPMLEAHRSVLLGIKNAEPKAKLPASRRKPQHDFPPLENLRQVVSAVVCAYLGGVNVQQRVFNSCL